MVEKTGPCPKKLKFDRGGRLETHLRYIFTEEIKSLLSTTFFPKISFQCCDRVDIPGTRTNVSLVRRSVIQSLQNYTSAKQTHSVPVATSQKVSVSDTPER